MDKVISFGEALVDLLSSKINLQSSEATETFVKYPGGAPANVAAAVGKLGGRSFFGGNVGEDMFGDFMRDSLQKAFVNPDYLLRTDEAKTALAFVSLDDMGERTFEFYRSPSADLFFQAGEFQASWFSEPGIFHFCSNTLTEPSIQSATLVGIQKARDAGFTISFDVNLRLNLWPKGRNPFDAIWQCIEYADVIKLCVEELKFLCRRQPENNVIQQMLEAGASIILITDGGNSLHYYTPITEGVITPPKVTMVDSTAAGDAFVGGFLYALAEREIAQTGVSSVTEDIDALETMLKFACTCGAHAVTHKGAFTSLPTQSDLITLGNL